MFSRVLYLFICFLSCLAPYLCHGQSLLNVNGADIYTAPGSVVYVDGDISDTAGNFLHNGTLGFTGNWENNSRNAVFDQQSAGWVVMAGGVQAIEGRETYFPNLSLQGDDKKILLVNATVKDTLDISDKEFVLNGNALNVLNNDAAAIARTTGGFINTTSNNQGHLLRAVKANDNYVYPLGGGTPFRYRPMTLTPENDGVIAAQFQDYDPDEDNYDRRKTNGDFRSINPNFYHTVKWIGIPGGAITATVPYNTETDSVYNALAYWGAANKDWRLTNNYSEYGEVGEGTDRAVKGTINDSETVALGLAHFIDNANIFIVTAFTPNGDGRNDFFVIKGLENYRSNTVEIYNRWGQMIYNRVGYKNNWKGEGQDIGVYYYQLRTLDFAGVEHYYKGNVTLIR